MSDSTQPPVDLTMLNEVFDNDAAQVREVLVLYLEQAGSQIQQMGKAIEAGKGTELNHHAHKCVGSSSSCGINDIVPLLRELERMGRENQLAGAPEAYLLVQQEFAVIQKFLTDYLK